MRHKKSILTEGDYELLLPNDENIFLYRRYTVTENWFILVNLSEKILPVPSILRDVNKKIVIANYLTRRYESENLRPYEAIIYSTKLTN